MPTFRDGSNDDDDVDDAVVDGVRLSLHMFYFLMYYSFCLPL